MASGGRKVGVSRKIGTDQTGEESSESDGETEPAKSFHRRLSTSKEIKRAAATKEGFLMKQTWSFNRWRRRYFQIKGHKLYYGKDAKDAIFDEIDLTDLSFAECSIKNINHSFQVITPFRRLVLCAASRREMEDWVSALKAAAARDYFESGEHHDFLSGRHRWYATSHARPTYCNVCRDALSGVMSNGLSCEVCKFKVHKRCAVKAISNCKWTTLSSVGKDIIEDIDGNITMPHQWLEGNLPVSAKCATCERTCGSVLRLQDWRCLWCHTTVHTACRPSLPVRCPLGPSRVSVVPPTALHNIGSDEAWEAVRPQGCSPLLVFVNSKSGDNQGVKFLRRFKQLLNPAQVFDLVSGGPGLGLRLFRHFDPFRVLVCSGDGSVGWVLSEIDRLNMHKQCQVGVLPLGTGNDLARVLGWGSSCDADAHLPQLLDRYEKASTKMLDRWSVLSYERGIDSSPVPTPAPGHAKSMAAYEDSVVTHLAHILHSDQTNVVISSAKILCETVKDFTVRAAEVSLGQGDDEFSTKCEVLREKLDLLLASLSREVESEISVPPERDAEEIEEKGVLEKSEKDLSNTQEQSAVQAKQMECIQREALMSRANSLKKAVRCLVEHTEQVVDEQNAQRQKKGVPSVTQRPMDTLKVLTCIESASSSEASPCPSPLDTRLTAISPLPDMRQDSTCEDLLTLAVPAPLEFADAEARRRSLEMDQTLVRPELLPVPAVSEEYRRKSMDEPCRGPPQEYRRSSMDENLLVPLRKKSMDMLQAPSNVEIFLTTPSDDEDEVVDLLSKETGEYYSPMELTSKDVKELGNILKLQSDVDENLTEDSNMLTVADVHVDTAENSDVARRISVVCLEDIGHIDSPETTEVEAEEPSLRSELEAAGFDPSSPEGDEEDEDPRGMPAAQLVKGCSLAHFEEGNDIARRSFYKQIRPTGRWKEKSRTCGALSDVGAQKDSGRDILEAVNIHIQGSSNNLKVSPRPSLTPSEGDDELIRYGEKGGHIGGELLGVMNIQIPTDTSKSPRSSLVPSEGDDEELQRYGKGREHAGTSLLDVVKIQIQGSSNNLKASPRPSLSPSEVDDEELARYHARALACQPIISVIVDPPSPSHSAEEDRTQRRDSQDSTGHLSASSGVSGLLRCSPAATRRISSGSLLKAPDSLVRGESEDTSSNTGLCKKLPIINPLVRLPMWPNVSGAGLISKVLLANADALCAAVSPLMDPDETLLEGFEGYYERCVMNNYFGIGIDAKISLDFHQKREEHPEKCRSRAKNYMWYGVLGSREWLQKTYKNLEQRVQLECDGQRIPLPSLQGIVVLNIPSFMGGTNFWGGSKEDDCFLAPSFDDRVLEVVAVFGSVQMAASRLINLQHHRIAQCQTVQISILGDEGVPVQVDGEAWLQPPGVIRIVHKNRMQMLCRNRALETSLRAWEEKQRHQQTMNHSLSGQSQGQTLHTGMSPFNSQENQLLLSFIESATTVVKYVKLVTISHPLVEPELYQLAVQTASHLEKVHPGGKIVEGPNLRPQVTELVSSARQLYEEACNLLRDKAQHLRLREDLEGKLSAALGSMEMELRRCVTYDSAGLVHFQQPPADDQGFAERKGRTRRLFRLRFRRGPGPGLGSTGLSYRAARDAVASWGVAEVAEWLEALQMTEYADSFTRNDIRGRELLTLGRRDLRELGVTKVGHVKRILQAVRELGM